MRLIGWLIGGFVIYLAATGQLMNYVNLALQPASGSSGTTGAAQPSSGTTNLLNQGIQSILGGSGATSGASSGVASGITTGAVSSGTSSLASGAMTL